MNEPKAACPKAACPRAWYNWHGATWFALTAVACALFWLEYSFAPGVRQEGWPLTHRDNLQALAAAYNVQSAERATGQSTQSTIKPWDISDATVNRTAFYANMAVCALTLVGTVLVTERWFRRSGWRIQIQLASLFALVGVAAALATFYKLGHDFETASRLKQSWNIMSNVDAADKSWLLFLPLYFGLACGVYAVVWAPLQLVNVATKALRARRATALADPFADGDAE